MTDSLFDITIKPVTQELICSVAAAFNPHKDNRNLDKYLQLQYSNMNRYQPHQGSRYSDEEVSHRFIIETALINLIARLLQSYLSCVSLENKSFPPRVFEVGDFYSWYKIEQLEDNILLNHVKDNWANAPLLTILDDINRLVTCFLPSYFGEYYTPIDMAQHLISETGINEQEILSGVKVVDPACGGGIILSLIVYRTFEWGKRLGYEPHIIKEALSNGLYGFDIQPFAVSLTKIVLNFIANVFCAQKSGFEATFQNIVLTDTLKGFDWWLAENQFSYVISNPPYMFVKKESLDNFDPYSPMVDGYPNLYQLFLIWGMKAIARKGKISYLIPQSILSGKYFQKVRTEMEQNGNIVGITRFTDRKGIFSDADQQVLSICWEKGNENNQIFISLRSVQNGNQIEKSSPINISKDMVIKTVRGKSQWVVCSEESDYSVYEKINNSSLPLSHLESYFVIGTGEYVWNQHKDLLAATKLDNYYFPLISAASIKPYTLIFPYEGGKKIKNRNFSRTSKKVEKLLHSSKTLLIQRITPKRFGHRIVCGIITDSFLNMHKQYLLENHVIYVEQTEQDSNLLLLGLMNYFNCAAINYLLNFSNGTAQLSNFEIGLLPVNIELLSSLSTIKGISSIIDQKKIDNLVFDFYDIDQNSRARILNWFYEGSKGNG